MFTHHRQPAAPFSLPSGRRADRKQRELHPDIFYRAKQEEDRNDDDDIFHWQDERTLVNDLLQHDGGQSESEDDTTFSMLIDQLPTAMNDQHAHILSELAQLMVPGMNRVRSAHLASKDKADNALGHAILQVDKAFKVVEGVTAEEYSLLQKEYKQSQEKIGLLLALLEDAISQREQLWQDLETWTQNDASALHTLFSSIPDEIEQVIADNEKQCKQLLSKNSKSGKDKIMKGLLGSYEPNSVRLYHPYTVS